MNFKHAIAALAVISMFAGGFAARGETNTVPVQDLTLVDEQGHAIVDDAQDEDQNVDPNTMQNPDDNLKRPHRHYRNYYRNYYRVYYRNYYRNYFRNYYRNYRNYYRYFFNNDVQPDENGNIPTPEMEQPNN